MIRAVKGLWLLLAMIGVVAIAGYCGYRLHASLSATTTIRAANWPPSDPEPFNPTHVTYEVFADDAAIATINYLDLLTQPHAVKDAATLPWSVTLTTAAPAGGVSYATQVDRVSIGCRVIVNDMVEDEKTSSGANAQTFCWVKSA